MQIADHRFELAAFGSRLGAAILPKLQRRLRQLTAGLSTVIYHLSREAGPSELPDGPALIENRQPA